MSLHQICRVNAMAVTLMVLRDANDVFLNLLPAVWTFFFPHLSCLLLPSSEGFYLVLTLCNGVWLLFFGYLLLSGGKQRGNGPR